MKRILENTPKNELINYDKLAKQLSMSQEDVQNYNPVHIAILTRAGKTYSRAKQLLDIGGVRIHDISYGNWLIQYEQYYGIDLQSIKSGETKHFQYVDFDGKEYVLFYTPMSRE